MNIRELTHHLSQRTNPSRPVSKTGVWVSKAFTYMAIAVWAVACFAFFHLCYPYHFYYQEQNQLFLMSSEYVSTYFDKPAWLACLTGDFLTQFYYYMYVGPAILTVVLLTAGDLLRRALQRCGMGNGAAWWGIALMTVMAVMHFHISYRLPSDIAVCGGIAVFLLYDIARCRISSWHFVFTLVLLVFCLYFSYRMFGYGCWLTALLAIISAFRQKAVYRWYTMASLPLIIFSATLVTNNIYRLYTYDNLTYSGLGRIGGPEMDLERELLVDNEYYFGHHDQVLAYVKSQESPTPGMSFFYYLVRAQRGELPDHLFDLSTIELGTLYQIGPDTPMLTIKQMNELYYVLGDMTFTERAAMLGNVFSRDNRNTRMTKRLAEANLISGDTLAAMKYLRLLDKTIVYHQWAKHHTPGIYMTPEVKAEIAHRQQFINRTDTLQVGDNLHIVMTELLKSNPENTAALDYMLCSLLLLKDIKSFKRDYDLFCIDTGRERIKPIYQQALMIYLAGSDAPQDQWEKYIKDPVQLQRFQEYNQRRGNPAFKDTYWYFFDKMKGAEY